MPALNAWWLTLDTLTDNITAIVFNVELIGFNWFQLELLTTHQRLTLTSNQGV